VSFSVAGPFVWNSLPDYMRDPAVSRDTFCKHLKTVFVCSVLIYVQRIRGFTTMRYINLRFTYLLTVITRRHRHRHGVDWGEHVDHDTFPHNVCGIDA